MGRYPYESAHQFSSKSDPLQLRYRGPFNGKSSKAHAVSHDLLVVRGHQKPHFRIGDPDLSIRSGAGSMTIRVVYSRAATL